MSKKYVIITGGSCGKVDVPSDAEKVIACDLGYLHAVKNGIKPDFIIGDFDSYTGDLPQDIPTMRYKKEKDDTDTMLAIKYAIEQGATEILVYGAFGGRVDHQLANIQSAIFAAEHGVLCCMKDENNSFYAFKDGEITVKRGKSGNVSIFALSNECKGVNATGLKYHLDSITLTNSFPIGVSNEFLDNESKISVQSGILAVVISDGV